MSPSVTIIGVGRVGGALAIALSEIGYTIDALIYRNDDVASRIAPLLKNRPRMLPLAEVDHIASDIAFIATQDSEIATAARELAQRIEGTSVVFHTSGSLSSSVISTILPVSVKAGSFHPLVSISSPETGALRFAGAYFCIEGDQVAAERGRQIVSDLGGSPFTVPANKKSLYHAAAVTSCGHITALIDVGIEMLTKCGLDDDQSKAVLMPLISSTVDNLRARTTSSALTGTFARRDLEGYERHLAALRGVVSPIVIEIYLDLALRSLDIVDRGTAPAESAARLRSAILLAKGLIK